MSNLNENIKRRVEKIEDRVDYDDLMDSFKISSAPIEVRTEAMNYLKAQYTQNDEQSHITTKEIIAADPPALPDTRENLEKELGTLLVELELVPKINLEKLLEEQKIVEKHINSRPGAIALAQNKIPLFNEYNKKYVQTIKEKNTFYGR